MFSKFAVPQEAYLQSLKRLSRLAWVVGALSVVVLTALASDDLLLAGKKPHPTGPLRISFTPLDLDSRNPARDHLGKLRFLSAWELRSTDPEFGGLSSMIAQNGHILALNDTGTLFGFDAPPAATGQFAEALPVQSREFQIDRMQWDSESIVEDPVTGKYWVGFELVQRICRYAPRFARIEECRVWPAIHAWPATESTEAMAHLPDGRFVVFSEGGAGPRGGNEALVFQGDPANGRSRPPISMSYIPPRGYRPTDAVSIGKGRVLVLNRRVTLLDGFTAALVVVDVSNLHAGAVLQGKEVARFASPILSDNYEAMAVEKRGGHSVLWIASDDNHKFFQRSLLLEFILPPELALP